MEQKIEYISDFSSLKLAESIQKITTSMNKKGYELTCISYQCKNGDSELFPNAILVFTKRNL